ncbi:myoD family inhibitor domain-containing protein 2-like [Archocentrus centrarchus]|uniref:myoD family inhibitor domain-containing protein 2-like n=1 Tax=Archocentrus centrarchus TaxID=63155 RepID=UPI0011EA2530|nr:myoD family inhibitor domain-containing protein 2-like [Archocentrus centrarchus]
MDDKINSVGTNEKVDDRNDDKPKVHDPLPTTSKLLVTLDSTADLTESLTEVTSFSEQISTEDTELSSVDISVNVFPHKTKRPSNTTGSVEDQPKPHSALLLSSTEASTVHEVSQSSKAKNRSQESLKTTTVHTDPGGDVLMACLFCHPLDCLLSTLRGFNGCVWWLCSSFCDCEPLLDVMHHCDLCECVGVRCLQSDCPVCDLCLHATECLDLAMEISQMLYH